MAAPTVAFAAVASWETTAAAADIPMLVVNAIPESPTTVKWVDAAQVGAGNITTWTDRVDSDYPSRYGYDGLPGYATQIGTAAPDDVVYWCLDLGSAGVEFDTAMIINHNFGTLSLAVGVTLEVADDNAFSTNLRTIADFGAPANDNRLVDTVLQHTGDGIAGAVRYSDVRYARLKIDNTAGGNITPYFGELILGRRYQMKHNPLAPFAKTGLHDNTARTTTAGGLTHTTVYSRRQFMLAANFREHEDTYTANMISFFQACRAPFVWIQEPNTDNTAWHFMTRDFDDFEFPVIDFTERQADIAGIEQGPEEFFLDQE